MRQRVQLSGGWAEADIGPRALTRVGDALLPSRVEVVLGGGPEKWPGLAMTLEVVDGRPQCRALTFRAAPSGREVRDADLSAARVEQWTEDVFALFALLLGRQEGTVTEWAQVASSADDAAAAQTVHAARRTRRLTAGFLRDVAATYLEHRTGRPTVAVAERYGVAHRTAAAWAKRATEEGFLPPTTPGRRRR